MYVYIKQHENNNKLNQESREREFIHEPTNIYTYCFLDRNEMSMTVSTVVTVICPIFLHDNVFRFRVSDLLSHCEEHSTMHVSD